MNALFPVEQIQDESLRAELTRVTELVELAASKEPHLTRQLALNNAMAIVQRFARELEAHRKNTNQESNNGSRGDAACRSD